MISAIITVVSILVLYALFLLFYAVTEKKYCSIVITALSPGDVAELISASNNAKANHIYIVTSFYDEKYFSYLEKHYLIKEVLTVVDRDN